jgi:iron(III) transport system ATP-binding protein
MSSPITGDAAAPAALTLGGVSKQFTGVTALDRVSLAVGEGEMLVLLGPSGCGKTTLLRCIAGLERPDAGQIRIGARLVTAIEQGVFMPPEKREIGMVFQSYAIWPHMTLYDNVAYPLRAMGMRRAAIGPRVLEALKLVRLDGLADRYSSQISGGQQQRVALARSLVGEPKLLLFDEPLSNLDANLRLQMRLEIKELQRRLAFTAVYVTHDQSEAMAIADRIAIMQAGGLRQLGSPRDIYERPADRFVAGFMGTTNFFDGTLAERRGAIALVRLGDGFELRAAGANGAQPGEAVHISVRPEDFDLLAPATRPHPDANIWPATVTFVSFLGDRIVYKLRSGECELEVHTRPTVAYDIGAAVSVTAAPERCIMLRQ